MKELSPEDTRRKRHLQMDQLSFDADIKRIERELERVDIELRRYKADMERLKVTIADLESNRDAHEKKREFLHTESEHVKRALTDLR